MVDLAMIVAAAKNNVIGRDGDMPWRLGSDLAQFKKVTMGKPVMMGRKTWDSLYVKPLPGRDNLVLSRNSKFSCEGASTYTSLHEMLEAGRAKAGEQGAKEAVLIGGGSLYEAALALCDRIYLSRVDAHPKGDTFFPELDPVQWRLVSQRPFAAGEKDDFAFVTQVFERA